jgi:hypothetical protein
MTNYLNIKGLLDKIKQLDEKYHHDIYTILLKHDLKYSSNKNGIFFDLEFITKDVVNEVNEYINLIDEIEGGMSIKDKATDKLLHQAGCEAKLTQTCSDERRYNLQDECNDILNTLKEPDDNIDVSLVLTQMEKDKFNITKKTNVNKFTIAKKKYSKPVINECKNDAVVLLGYDI